MTAPTRTRWLWAGVLVGGALFGVLAVDQVLHGPVYQADFPVYAATDQLVAQGIAIHPWGNLMSQPGSALVDAPLLVAATVTLWLWRRRDLASWCLGIGTAIGWLNPLLKAVFQRPLPPFIHARFPHSYAFPSGHTMGAAGTLGIAILLLAEAHVWRKGLTGRDAQGIRMLAIGVWVSLSLICGVGRILAQHHWISDVLAAWAISPALVCGGLLLVDRYAKPRPQPVA
jgi:membrane-associated phospholipid phosphatase